MTYAVVEIYERANAMNCRTTQHQLVCEGEHKRFRPLGASWNQEGSPLQYIFYDSVGAILANMPASAFYVQEVIALV